MIIDSFASADVLFQEADDGAAATQVGGQLGAGDAYGFFGHCVGVIGNHDAAILPHDPIQIWDGPSDVLTATVWAGPFCQWCPASCRHRIRRLAETWVG
jgi:hypothetical protein